MKWLLQGTLRLRYSLTGEQIQNGRTVDEISSDPKLLDVALHCSVLVFPLTKLLCWKFRNFLLRNKALVYFAYLLCCFLILLYGSLNNCLSTWPQGLIARPNANTSFIFSLHVNLFSLIIGHELMPFFSRSEATLSKHFGLHSKLAREATFHENDLWWRTAGPNWLEEIT